MAEETEKGPAVELDDPSGVFADYPMVLLQKIESAGGHRGVVASRNIKAGEVCRIPPLHLFFRRHYVCLLHNCSSGSRLRSSCWLFVLGSTKQMRTICCNFE
jgi:hypothetical protein